MDFYTTSELAKLLKVKKTTIWAWVRNGEIPYCKIRKRIYRFDRGQIARWIKEKEGGQ